MESPGRVALVTGTAGGIGAVVAAQLTQTCKTVIGLDVSGADQSAVHQACAAMGANFIAQEADIADESSVATSFLAVQDIGRLDIVVHCAGIAAPTGRAPLTENMPAADWQRMMDVNMTGTFLVCRAAIPWLRRNGWGRIITMSSQTARLASAVVGAHYAASKAGVIAMTRVLALELASAGITVNCVAPGLTDTRMAAGFDVDAYAKTVPLGRLGQPADVAQAVAFLASDDAQYITGVTLDVNGGKFMP